VRSCCRRVCRRGDIFGRPGGSYRKFARRNRLEACNPAHAGVARHYGRDVNRNREITLNRSLICRTMLAAIASVAVVALPAMAAPVTAYAESRGSPVADIPAPGGTGTDGRCIVRLHPEADTARSERRPFRHQYMTSYRRQLDLGCGDHGLLLSRRPLTVREM
jgi:hypothetical protein